MPTYKELRVLADTLVENVTRDSTSWKEFLDSASYTYAYSFANQLLIHGQRPGVMAVATMEYWNRKAQRWVSRGSRGIAILDTHTERSRLRYVFAIEDTHANVSVPEAMPWAVTDTNRSELITRLLQSHSAQSLPDAIHFWAAECIAQRRVMFAQALSRAVTGSQLERHDAEEQRRMLEDLIQRSVVYMLLRRSGMQMEYDAATAFESVTEFNTIAAAVMLGSAVQQVSRPMLMELGRVVRQIDSVAKEHETVHTTIGEQKTLNDYKEATEDDHDLHQHQRVSDPEPDIGRTTSRSNREIRDAAQGVSERERPRAIRTDEHPGNAVSASDRDRQNRASAGGADGSAVSTEEQDAGPQVRFAGLDTVDEQPESAGGRTGDADAVRPVTEYLSQAESDKSPSAFLLPAVPEHLLDAALAVGGPGRRPNEEIYAYFESHKDDAERCNYLSGIYDDAYCEFYADGVRLGCKKEPEGLWIWKGNFLTRTNESRVTWQTAVSGIESLMQRGKFVAPLRLPDAQPEAAETIAAQLQFLPEEQVPPVEKKLPPRPLPIPQKDTEGKITEQEIERALRNGSGFQNGKLRIFRRLSQPVPPPEEETAAWLKKEYGTGGQSWTFLDGMSGWLDYDSKGFEIQYDTGDRRLTRHFGWKEMAWRLTQLIRQGGYFTEQETEKYTVWLREQESQEAQARSEQKLAESMIRDFCERNAFSEPDFTDPTHISLAYSTTGDGDHEITAFANLVRYEITLQVDGRTVESRQYSSNAEFVDKELANIEFDALIADAEAAFEKRPTQEPVSTRPCVVDDVVYLENGTPFVIQDIGEQSILVCDKAVPLFSRSISREEFSRLLKRDERNRNLRAPEQAEPIPESEPLFEEGATPFVEQVMADAKALSEPFTYEPINYTAPYRPQIPSGPKEKFAVNVAAIRLLKSIEQRVANGGMPANADEQSVLAQYCGWGGLADAFDENKTAWSKEYAELKALLTESEYQAARSSTLTAFFTPAEVIHPMYRALERMGVHGGNILEPSMGTGAFFAHKPSSFDQNNAKLYGVELDDLTGRIAKQLYQKARIQITGFEKATLPDSFFDCAVGNVPFGDFSVIDRQYDKLHFRIHDYFLAKTIDKVRNGGIIAFITTSGTMDKKNEEVRRYIAARCDLLGAVRLPDTTFKRNAGTQAVADILFLQKRDRIVERDEPWLHLGETKDGIPVNQYFADHPEMVCGTIRMVSGPYGQVPTCEPSGDGTLEEQLDRALGNLSGTLTKEEAVQEEPGAADEDTIEADPDVRNFSYTIQDDKIYFRTNSIMRRVTSGVAAESRIRKLIGLRDTVRQLLTAQLDDHPDEEIQRLQQQLNSQYDAYHRQHGLINSRGSAQAFQDDSSYYLLCSLEDIDEEGRLRGKSDMFTKRTIRSARPAERADTASDALALSIGEKAGIDMPYMMLLTGKTEEQLAEELTGVIFTDPMEKGPDGKPIYRTADEYLSGNVREKLAVAKLAAQTNPALRVNVQALEQVQPKDLEASEIAVRLGATWIEPAIIKQFADELVDAPSVSRRLVEVHYAPYTGVWNISGKSCTGGNVKALVTYGTNRANFYHILEESLNLRAIRIFDMVRDAEGMEHPVLNQQETQAAQAKQQQIEEAFKEWIWQDQTRRQQLVRLYNERFNSTRPREYDGSHILFHGMNPEIVLRPHQRNAVAHILYGGNTLLGHVVGAGKTYEMVAAAMEKKRLGLCSKTLICVPNHLTEQLASEALQLYPNANILVAKRADFERANRKRFCGRIATGNYDIIVIGHSQFERIPLSTERQASYLQRQIDEIVEQTATLRQERAEKFTIKQMERTRKQLEKRLAKLNDTERKDDVVTFEELGVDSLMVDEAHMFKNLMCVSKMRNVAGISQSESQRASDLLMKTMYLDEITGGRGVTFATGTPISNSMTELYTMMRYLQRHTLEQKGLAIFDAWASTFGETVTAIELAPEGTGYRTKTRFARFYNLPELMSLFKESADIQTADMLKLPVPALEGGKPTNVQLKPSSIQKEMVAELGKRADTVRNREVDPSQDNMLKITNDGRKLALDQRLIDETLPDDPGSKVNACVERVFSIWKRTKANRSTQLIFCDLSTPKAGVFNVYHDVRGKLIALGVPAEEIQFIHDANTETRKADLFRKMRSGAVRILMGSTAKMGAGTNVQKKLIALHHLDVPWRPSDIEQREGRMVRQGNENKEVAIYRYVTEGTFDAYSWQLIENKQRFIGQIMTGKSPARSCDDMDEAALSYAEVKALAAGNPAIKEKMDLDIQVTKLRTLKAQYASQKYRLEDAITIAYPREIQRTKGIIANCQADAKTIQENTRIDPEGKEIFSLSIQDTAYDTRENAGKALLELVGTAMDSEQPVPIGSYKGLTIQAVYLPFEKEFHAQLVGAGVYDVTLGADALGNIIRLTNAAASMQKRIESSQESLRQLEKQLQNAQEELQKPFAHEQELADKSKRLAELNALLNMNEKETAIDSVPDEESQACQRVIRQPEPQVR